jgi:hypothetical protein
VKNRALHQHVAKRFSVGDTAALPGISRRAAGGNAKFVARSRRLCILKTRSEFPGRHQEKVSAHAHRRMRTVIVCLLPTNSVVRSSRPVELRVRRRDFVGIRVDSNTIDIIDGANAR